MNSKPLFSELKWLLLSVVVTSILLLLLRDTINITANNSNGLHLFIGLNNFMEILTYFTFSTFVVFGIKGFYDMYSHKISNVIMISSGLFLVLIIFYLSCQILLDT
jgi:hypothetical protein